MKIGIFGGSFNPPHKMHLKVACELIRLKELDKVIFVPTGNKYNKRNLLAFSDRLNMINIAIKNEEIKSKKIENKEIENIEVSSIENKEDVMYTFETLSYFKNKYKNDDIYFVMGFDNLNDFDTWREYEYMLKKFKFLVVLRKIKCNDKNEITLHDVLKKYDKYKNNIVISNACMKDMSSTNIRSLLKEGKEDKEDKEVELEKYLDKDVLKYIRENNLYNI